MCMYIYIYIYITASPVNLKFVANLRIDTVADFGRHGVWPICGRILRIRG